MSERIFSVTGRIVQQCRQNLDDELVDDIMSLEILEKLCYKTL